jgi:Transglutaminase-like superfamily
VLLLEAVAWLAVARLAILLLPFRLLTEIAGRASSAPTREADSRLAFRIGNAVDTAARIVPWRAVCLPRAIAARLMLARRGRGSVLHFGVGKGEGGALHAHAWLEAEGTVVVGRGGAASVTHLAQFGHAWAGAEQ